MYGRDTAVCRTGTDEIELFSETTHTFQSENVSYAVTVL